MSEYTMTAIKPAVRAPLECVQRLVRVLICPAIKEDLGFPGGFGFIAVGDGNEHEIRRRPDPHPAKTNFKAADEIQAFFENRAPVKFAITVRVFEYENAVTTLAF